MSIDAWMRLLVWTNSEEDIDVIKFYLTAERRRDLTDSELPIDVTKEYS